MGNWFDKIKYYYDNKLWDESRVARAVELGKITQEEYMEIVSLEKGNEKRYTRSKEKK